MGQPKLSRDVERYPSCIGYGPGSTPSSVRFRGFSRSGNPVGDRYAADPIMTAPCPAFPCIASTWSFSVRGNASAWPALAAGGDPLDAVLEACRVAEEDPSVDSVGFGGLPDAEGHVTLDGCVMRSPAECGSACALRDHLHPARVARWVMERTAHVMLAGEAADRFADAQGEPRRELLSPEARAAWEKWRAAPAATDTAAAQARDRALRPVDTGIPGAGALFNANARSERRWHAHDTIGTIALGADGRMAGACSTSGMPWKVPGRVGDSPIIGHGLYVDPEAGGATGTGAGELIMGVCGSFLAVEEMRRGATPLEAARSVVERIGRSYRIEPQHQAAFVVMGRDGTVAAAALRTGFLVAIRTPAGERLEPPGFTLRDD
jgi:N4-(beta-N-acetylglucosaminyl)-L-asparaginase